MISWKWHKFNELDIEQLYSVLSLRQEIFIVEQKCPYQDIDHQDQLALHLLGIKNHKLVAYLRLFPKGALYPDSLSLGRFLVERNERGQGLAKEAMQQVELYLKETNTTARVIISAQVYLQKFYATYGYLAEGEPFDLDGIPHIEMIYQPIKNLS